jgi:hypothetical protein
LQQGQWSAAAGWCEQAVAEKRKGDIFGRVDQSSVANSGLLIKLRPLPLQLI